MEGSTGGNRSLEKLKDAGSVFRMNRFVYVPGRQLSPRAEILDDLAIDGFEFTVGGHDRNETGYSVNGRPILRLAHLQIAVGVRKRQRALLLGFEQAHVFDHERRLVGEGLEKRDLLVGERSDLPSPERNCSHGGPLAQQRCPERCVMALTPCVIAAHRELAILHREIVDMNRAPITYGSSYHPVAI